MARVIKVQIDNIINFINLKIDMEVNFVRKSVALLGNGGQIILRFFSLIFELMAWIVIMMGFDMGFMR